LLNNEVINILNPSHENTLFAFVGNTMRSDDGIAQYLYKLLNNASKKILLLNVDDRPENMLDYLTDKSFNKIIIFDAANFNGQPGEIKYISEENINQTILSTHTFPLSLISKIIKEDTKADVFFIGIQIKNVNYGTNISEELICSAKIIANYILKEYSYA
jgi:hydrogenase 3 maturation protease